jgi:hypothetical protein
VHRRDVDEASRQHFVGVVAASNPLGAGMGRVHDGTAAQIECAHVRRRIAGIEPGEAPRVPLANQHRARIVLRYSSAVETSRRAAREPLRPRTHKRPCKGPEHVDHDCAASCGACARHVVEHVDDQAGLAVALMGTILARGMKLKSVAVAAVYAPIM